MTRQAAIQFPRTVVFDWTTTGNGTATGEIKYNLFGSPSTSDCIFVSHEGSEVRIEDKAEIRRLTSDADAEIYHILDAFQPQLILYRPVADSDRFHRLAMEYIARRNDLPLVVWIMDDWLDRMKLSEPARFRQYDSDWRMLLARATTRLSISDAMSDAFAKRYGTSFVAIANGVVPDQWPQPKTKPGSPFKLRYAGGLAGDMTAASVYRVARTVEKMAKAGRSITFEIQTRPWWHKSEAARYARLKHTSFSTDDKSAQAYRDWLADADAVLIAYNFDEESLRYTHASLANKLPECLACGVPLLALGPATTATIRYLRELEHELILDDDNNRKIAATLAELMDNTERYAAIAANGQSLAFEKFNLATARTRLSQALWQAADSKPASVNGNAAYAAISAQLSPKKGMEALSRPSLRERILNDARRRNPLLYRSLQLAGYGQRLVARNKALTCLVVLAVAALVYAAWYFPQPLIRFSALGALGAAAIALFVVALVGFVANRTRANLSQLRSRLEMQTRELQASQNAVARLESRLTTDTASRLAALSDELRQQVASTRNEINDTSQMLLRLDDGLSLEKVSRAALAGELQRMETELSALKKAVTSDLAKQVSTEAKKTSGALQEIHRKIDAQSSHSDDQARRVGDDISRLDATLKPASVLNLGLYQRFNRRLSEEQVANLSTKWAAALGMKLTRARLGYLAHRACFMENMMKGRLATSIETIVLRSLVCAAVDRRDVSILEIGTLFGVGAAAVYEAALNNHPSVHLTVLDPLDGYYAAGHMDLLTGAEVSEKTLRQNFNVAPVPEDDYTVIRHLSTDEMAFEAASKRAYDALIIDGDHSYDGVKYDFDKYGPLVREGGFILFDDYDVEDWPDIKRYVDTEIEGLPHLEKIGTDYRTAVYRVKATGAVENMA